jgi:hypothetical protein
MKIDKPGIYYGVLDADYRADPCPSPSLTQSTVKILIEQSAQHAWTANPRFNPNWKPDNDAKFDVGNAAHRLVLGRGKEFEIIDAPDWRTKKAQDMRLDAASRGKIGILKEQFERAVDMSLSAFDQLKRHEDRTAFQDGNAEVMICWEEDGIWFRSLIDWLHTDLRTVDDYKSSGMSMAPHMIGIRAEAAGWHVQASFIERGLDILDPAGAGRRKFRFIGQETQEPYALSVMHMTEEFMTMGRKQVEAGVSIWRNCMKTGRWPGYSSRSVMPQYPTYKMKNWLEREESEFSLPSLMGG